MYDSNPFCLFTSEKKHMKINDLYLAVGISDDFSDGDIISKEALGDYADDSSYTIYKLSLTEVKVSLEVSPVKRQVKVKRGRPKGSKNKK